MKTKLLDVIDFEKVDTLLEGFNKSTGFVTAILDLEGNVLSKSGWRQICTEFHRIHPETSKKCTISDTVLAGKLAEGEKYHFYQCLNGLVDVAVPIVIKGEHIANLFSGQFFFEDPDNSFFKKQAEKYGFNEKIYLKALGKVPVVSKEKVLVAMDFLLNMTQIISDMTFQKLEQMEDKEAIKESEKYNRMLFEQSAIGLLLTSLDGKLIDINQASANIIGRTIEEAKTLTYWDITPEKYQNQEQLQLESLAKTGRYGPYEKEYIHKDGHLVPVRLQGLIIERHEEKFIWSSVEDISERKQAEEKLRESEYRFRKLYEDGATGMVMVGKNFKFLAANQSFCQMVGYQEEELQQLTFLDITHPDDKDKDIPHVKKMIAGEIDVYRTEKRYLNKNGQTIWTQLTLSTFYDANGQFLYNLAIIINITEHKRAELELVDSEERLRLTTEQADIAVWEYDFNTNLMSRSRNHDRLYGLEWQTKWDINTFLNATHPEDREYSNTYIQNAVASGGPDNYKFDFRVALSDNSIRWLSVSGRVIERSKSGQGIKIRGILTDITMQKNAELDLIGMSRIMKNSQEIAHLGSFEFVAATQTTIWSEEEYRIYGLDPTGPSPEYHVMLEKCIHPEDAKLLHDTFMTAIQNQGVYELEHRIVRPDGSVRWVYDKANPYFDEHGNLLRYVGATLDITERKQAEEKLIDSEYRYRKIYEDGATGMVLIDKDFKFITANRTFCQMIEYQEEELQQLTFVDITYPEDNDRDIPQVKKMMTREIDVYRAEKRFLNKNGQTIWAQITASPIYDSNGQFLYILGIIVNVTERKKAEEKLEESYTLIKIAGEIAKLGGWVVNLEENRCYWGNEVAAIHEVPIGYSPLVEEGIGFYAPEWRDKITEVFTNCAQNGVPYDEEMQILTAKGKRVWVRTIGEAVKDSNGKIVKVQGAFQDISERKIAEEVLRDSETKLKRILNNLQDAYLQADLDGNITFANTTAAKIYGYANIQEMIGLPTSNLYKDKAEREKLIVNLSKSEKLTDIIGEGLKKDDTTFWVSISVQFLKDNQGKIIGTEGLIRDITNRKNTEDQILKLSQAVEQSPASIILTDTKGNVEYANPKTLKITGYTLEEIKGKNPKIFSSGEKPKNEYENLWETILSGKEWRGEFHNKKKSGELFWELASISPIINEKGEIINFLAVKEDITDRKQILNDLIVAKEHAEKSEIRLLEAQKITKVGSWETDLSNLKVIWSDETYRIFEINANTFQATHQAFLNFVHPDDKKIVADAFAKSFETKAYNSIEHRIITAKDTIKYVEERWKIVFNEEEKPTRAIGTCQDITERKQAEQALKEAKEKAEESDRLKSAFLANMSHEIRTPMNGILGFAGLLKEPGISGERQQNYIEIIQKSGDRMLNIINDIVDISKIESGTMKVYITETDINEKIENLFQFFKPEAEVKNIQFSVKKSLPKNKAIIKTDAEKVYAVLSNLLKNAIKFTNEGEIEFGVEYTSSSNGQKQLIFFVKDTGIGIAKDRQQAIFERFIQADIYDNMARQGAGLGLSISKAYVEMLGGKIWLESEQGIGSVFYFTIPCNNETENGFVQDDNDSIKADAKAGKLKILIAEDDEASSIYLSILVEEFSSEILLANNGIEAVELYKNNPNIDLILMDIQMPYLNGYEATSQIRQLNKNVVIIAQTAFALSYDRQKVIDAGCDDYIPKPILMNDLKTLIKNYFA